SGAAGESPSAGGGSSGGGSASGAAGTTGRLRGAGAGADDTTSTRCARCAGLATATSASSLAASTVDGSDTATLTTMSKPLDPGSGAPLVADQTVAPCSRTTTLPPLKICTCAANPFEVPRIR